MKKTKLIRNVTALFAVLVSVVFISCGALFGDEQTGNLTINFPPISSQARAISSDKIGDLKTVTTSYRVTVNGMTREGTGSTFNFTLPVGVVAEITVECLNSGNVIVRAKKTHTVKAGTNNVNINLSQDGETFPGKVTYNGNGADSGTPSDTQTYDIGNEVTLQTGEPTRTGYTFMGWTSNVELKYNDAGQEKTIPKGVEFARGGSNVATNIKITSFKMPVGGVVLTAKWQGDLTSTPTVGSIIMKDGSIRTADNIGSDTADAIAVVYKVSGRKAWAVGKELMGDLAWAVSGAQGLDNDIIGLREESGYKDGSTGLDILIDAAPDAANELETKYPAWDYACNYGTKQNLTNFRTGWYLPSKQELQEVYDKKDNMLPLIDFGTTYYYSSSQVASSNKYAHYLVFSRGEWLPSSKFTYGSVCAVRVFTY